VRRHVFPPQQPACRCMIIPWLTRGGGLACPELCATALRGWAPALTAEWLRTKRVRDIPKRVQEFRCKWGSREKCLEEVVALLERGARRLSVSARRVICF
jgi:hypothetical protein